VNGLLVATFTLELNYPGDLCEERIVFTETHVLSGIDARPPLTHDDTAGQNGFTPVRFNAQSLTVRIATVTGAADTLFMSHYELPLSL